ncbi:MAG: hypothetical protein ACXU7D_07790 [Burkholderiaceae bacterium]
MLPEPLVPLPLDPVPLEVLPPEDPEEPVPLEGVPAALPGVALGEPLAVLPPAMPLDVPVPL